MVTYLIIKYLPTCGNVDFNNVTVISWEIHFHRCVPTTVASKNVNKNKITVEYKT